MAQNNHLNIEQRWDYYREPAILAASGGAIDTISFITLFGLFTAHVTGNLVVAGAALADNIEGIFTKLAAIPVFMLTVAIATLIIQSRKTYTPGLLAGVLCAEMVFLGLFTLCGYLYSPFSGAGDVHVFITGMFGIMAMGIRNAASRLLLSSTSPSTMMTGNVTQLTIDIISLVRNPAADVRGRLGKSAASVAGFILGAGIAALLYMLVGFFSTLLPIALTGSVALREIKTMKTRQQQQQVSVD